MGRGQTSWISSGAFVSTGVLDQCDRLRYSRERTVQSLGAKDDVKVMEKVHQVMTKVHVNIGCASWRTAAGQHSGKALGHGV